MNKFNISKINIHKFVYKQTEIFVHNKELYKMKDEPTTGRGYLQSMQLLCVQGDAQTVHSTFVCNGKTSEGEVH